MINTINTLSAAKKAGYTEIKRGKWSPLEHNVNAKYFKVELPRTYDNEYAVEIRHNYATNPTTGQTVAVPEYRAIWFVNEWRPGKRSDYDYKVIKREQVDLTQFRLDREKAAEEKEIAEYTTKLNNFNVDRFMNINEAEEYLDEIAKHIDVEPSVREDLLRRTKEAIGGPNDWCEVVVLTDQYADNNPREHSKIKYKGLSKQQAADYAHGDNMIVYQHTNVWCSWEYKYMRTSEAAEFLAKQIQREDDIHSGKIKVEHR